MTLSYYSPSSINPWQDFFFCCPKRQFSLEPKMFDIFNTRSTFLSQLYAPNMKLLLYGKSPHKHVLARKSYNQISRTYIFEELSLKKDNGHVTKAVTIVEPEVSLLSHNDQNDLSRRFESEFRSQEMITTDYVSSEIDDKEKLRRMRISKANSGNVPWNKGRKHSPETLQRIRERTRLAMQNPKVKMKLMNLGHAQSEETRKKIGRGVREGWQRRRDMLMIQESCLFEWQNIVAEASRKGNANEDELQWDSYQTIDEQLKIEWLESVEKRKTMCRPKGSKRAPKSPEQRRKISQAISAKWADPEYRGRVCSALSKYHGVTVGEGRQRRRRTSSGNSSVKRERATRKPSKSKGSDDESMTFKKVPVKRRKNTAPSYKDPNASSKLEMIRRIREERAEMENKKKEAVERAKLLIAEAEKAAKALEIAALKSPLAKASLIETRKLISEAIQSIESIESGKLETEDSLDSSNQFTNEPQENEKSLDDQVVNGSRNLKIDQMNIEEFDFDKLTLQDGAKEGSLSDQPPKINGSTKENVKPSTVTKTKKWVCGKLVEVEE